MTIVKETSPTSFSVEQNLQTMMGAKTLTLDAKTNHILTMAAEYGPPPATARPGTNATRFVFDPSRGQVNGKPDCPRI